MSGLSELSAKKNTIAALEDFETIRRALKKTGLLSEFIGNIYPQKNWSADEIDKTNRKALALLGFQEGMYISDCVAIINIFLPTDECRSSEFISNIARKRGQMNWIKVSERVP